MNCTQAGKDARVLWNPKVETLKPLQSAVWVSHHIIHSSYLHTLAQFTATTLLLPVEPVLCVLSKLDCPPNLDGILVGLQVFPI